MASPRAIRAVAGALLAAGVVGVLAAGGCSKEQPPAPVIKVQPQQPQAAQNAPAPAARPAPQGQAQAGGGAPDHQVGESVLHAPGDYLYTATVTVPRYAKKTVSAVYVESEIKDFHALKGRWPKSLDELSQWLGEPVQKAPGGMKYSYDPKTGALEVVPAD